MPRDSRVHIEDIVIHAYYSVDLDIIWDIVTHKVPSLAQRVHALLA